MRDAHQSLLATRVRTEDVVKGAAIANELLADAFSLETWGGATFGLSLQNGACECLPLTCISIFIHRCVYALLGRMPLGQVAGDPGSMPQRVLAGGLTRSSSSAPVFSLIFLQCVTLQMLIRGANAVGYTSYPDNVVTEFVRLAAVNGMDIFRIFDCFNIVDNMRVAINAVRESNKVAEVCLCYTGQPRTC